MWDRLGLALDRRGDDESSRSGGEKTGSHPIDRGKGGVKRSRLTEGRDVPIGVVIEGAHRHNMKLVRLTIQSIVIERPEPTKGHPQGMCLDKKGYDYDEVYAILQEFGFTTHVRPRGEEAKAIKREACFKARSFVVERAHSWTLRLRRLLIHGDKKLDNSPGFLHFACGLIAFRSGGLFG